MVDKHIVDKFYIYYVSKYVKNCKPRARREKLKTFLNKTQTLNVQSFLVAWSRPISELGSLWSSLLFLCISLGYVAKSFLKGEPFTDLDLSILRHLRNTKSLPGLVEKANRRWLYLHDHTIYSSENFSSAKRTKRQVFPVVPSPTTTTLTVPPSSAMASTNQGHALSPSFGLRCLCSWSLATLRENILVGKFR